MNLIVSQKDEIQNHASKFIKKYQIGKIMKRSNFHKDKGLSCIVLFRFIFMLVFTGKNLYRFLQSEITDGQPGKDTVYRFLNSARYNWRKLLRHY